MVILIGWYSKSILFFADNYYTDCVIVLQMSNRITEH